MKKIVFTNHLKTRIAIRKIPKELIEKILLSPHRSFYDKLNNTLINISLYKGRYYMVAYVLENDILKAITIHPIRLNQIENRIGKGRWVELKEIS